MAFTLYTSNRMEMLAAQLAAVLARPLGSPLAGETIVLQSRGMQRWLAMELARRIGVWANCQYPFPNSFVWNLFTATMPGMPAADPYAPAVLTWRIMRLLETLAARPEFAEIRGYLRGGNEVLKKYQLACRIADTFDQYTVYRADLLARWEAGEAGEWQAVLWRALLAEIDGPHRGAVQADFLQRLAAGSIDRKLLPERIAVFGISYLPAFHLQVFGALADCCEVNVFVLSPCQEYWGDLLAGRSVASLATTADAFDPGNPLLASLGRLGRDFSNLLLDAAHLSISDIDLYRPATGDTVLARLQNDILQLRAAGGDVIETAAADGSIGFHSCHSPLREVEVLYDNLLQMFNEDPTLHPRDILVMIPDIETYAPLINAVFSGGGKPTERLPYTIADRSLGSGGKLAAAFRAILELAGKRFTAPAVMDILACPAVHGRFGIARHELDRVRKWIEETGIRWGMDARDRQAAGLAPYRENSWQAGLERLLLGYALPEDEGALFHGILPYDDMEGSGPALLGRLAAFVTQLHDALTDVASPRPLVAWKELLQSLVGRFLAADEDDERDAAFIDRLLGELGSLETAAGYAAAVDMPVVRSWLLERMAAEKRDAGFLSGGITFCAMLPMRSIPFKVIALLGMNDGVFPRQGRTPGFDLISRFPRPGDRSLRHEDRYLFLEAILSARQRLYVSYTGQSIVDNSVIPPSTVVSELRDYLHNGSPAGGDILGQLTTAHRLQSFSPAYFTGDSKLFSYSGENFTAVVTASATTGETRNFFPTGLPEPPAAARTVQVSTLLAFYANPAAHLLRSRLGIRLDDPLEPLEEREPFTLAGLDAYQLRQELLERLVADGESEPVLEMFRAGGILPPAPYGERVFRRVAAAMAGLATEVRDAGGGVDVLPPLECDLQLGPFRLQGRLDGVVSGCLLRYRAGSLAARDQVKLWIEHLLLNRLQAAGYPVASRLMMLDGRVELLPVTAAEEQLQMLLDLYWEGLQQPLKFFPETSLAYARTGSLDAAAKVWNRERFPERDDRYLQLCFGEVSPLDGEFARIAEAVFSGYRRHLRGAS